MAKLINAWAFLKYWGHATSNMPRLWCSMTVHFPRSVVIFLISYVFWFLSYEYFKKWSEAFIVQF